MGGVLATYTYISPMLTDRTGLPAAFVPPVLIGFGSGALAGTLTGGRLGDRRPIRTALTGAVATTIVLAVLTVTAQYPVAAAVLVALMGRFPFAVNPVVTAVAVQSAGSAPTPAAALSTSAFNVGIAAGSSVAGLTLSTPLGLSGPPAVGAVIAGLTVVPLLFLRRRPEKNQTSGTAPIRQPAQAPTGRELAAAASS